MAPPPPAPPRPPPREVSLLALLPNLVTLAAICAGLTAIRFASSGRFAEAVLLLVLAALLDGMDGRLARLLKNESALGAELDSLADFVNFGVVPPLVIHLWALEELGSAGWITVLVFAICAVLRLARFNVAAKAGIPGAPGFFTGVPAPAGAMLCLLPLFLAQAGDGTPPVPPLAIAAYMALVGVLMISRLPTWSLKGVRVPRGRAFVLLTGLGAVIVALFSYPWAALVTLDLAYLASLVHAARHYRRRHGRLLIPVER